MAAVLCQSMSQLCRGCAEVLAWPCKKGCECCGRSCDAVQDLICSPFVPYLATTLALNIAPALYGMRSYMRCEDALWLTINGFLAAVHIVGAIYIVYKIQTDEEPQVATAYAYAEDGEVGNSKAGDQKAETTYNSEVLRKIFSVSDARATHLNDEGGASVAGSMKRMGHVMCHDVGVAIYMLVFAFWCVWQMFGVASLAKVKDEENDGSCDAGAWIITSLVCGFLYTGLVFCAFGCSFICLR